jgi:hypothetical protein
MAKGDGIFSRIVNFVRDIFTTEEHERERQPVREPEHEAPEPPEQRRRIRLSHPEYDPDDDSWHGVSARDWQRISDIAHQQLGSGATFNLNINVNTNGLFITEDKATDLHAIITALESGAISTSEMIALLRYRQGAARDVAYSQDTRRGAALWNSRNPRLPEELYWYQWGW